MKCQPPSSDHSAAVSSGCLDTNYSSTAIDDTPMPIQPNRTLCGFSTSSNTSSSPPFSHQHHQQPLSSTTSNIPHSTVGNIVSGNSTNTNCNISAIGHVNGTLLSHHHHHHQNHPLQHNLHGHPQHPQQLMIGTLPNISHHHLHLHHHLLHGANRTPPPPTTSAAAALMAALCGSCCGPISDRYIMRVVDAFYHENCLQCTSCSVHLMHSCFSRNGKLYCRVDYERWVRMEMYGDGGGIVKLFVQWL